MASTTNPGHRIKILAAATITLTATLPPHGQQAPAARAHHQVVFHTANQRVYLIGGSTRRGDGYHTFDDVWHWSGSRWIRDGALPFARSSHGVIYHGQRKSLILFGGAFGRALRAEGIVWEQRDGEWRALDGDYRAASSEPGMCYDSKRDRVVFFGGWNDAAEYRGDTWEWTGVQLVRVDSSGPGARAGHAFVFDPVSQRCLLFGGRGAVGYLGDTWEWDGVSWRELQAAGPSPRWFFGSAADLDGKRVIVFGGRGPGASVVGRDGAGDLNDTWAWNGRHWELLATDGPAARSMAKLAFTGSSILLFGGRVEMAEGFEDRNDTWELRARSWLRRN